MLKGSAGFEVITIQLPLRCLSSLPAWNELSRLGEADGRARLHLSRSNIQFRSRGSISEHDCHPAG